MPGQNHRYLAALPRGDGKVFISWRLLAGDAPDAPFYLERRAPGGHWQRVMDEPIVKATNYLDATSPAGQYSYRVTEPDGASSEEVSVDSTAPATVCVVDVPLPHSAQDTWRLGLGDLDNDGRIDYVVPLLVDGEFTLFAYHHDGRLMWNFPTGLLSDEISGNSPLSIWDINADGRTEVVVRRGGKGWAKELAAVRRGEQVPRTKAERSPLKQGETLVALDGETGQIVWEVPIEGNSRAVKTATAHVQGVGKPALVVVQTGTYKDAVTTGYDGLDGRLIWRVTQVRGAGHSVDIADIDGDGKDEILSGGICYNGDGTILWEAEPFGHTDISKPAYIDPSREGLQVWFAVEGPPKELNGVYFVDNKGQTIFKEPYRHAHYGWIARHTADVPGLQPHTAEDARHEYGAADAGMREEGHFPIFLPDGSHWLNLTEWQRKNLVPVHWDAGPEVVFIVRKKDKRIVRLLPNGQTENLCEGTLPAGGRYGRNLGTADVIGDFRENIVTVDLERSRLMVLANPTECNVRGYSPYDDLQYRHDRSQHGSGYHIYLSPPDTVVNR